MFCIALEHLQQNLVCFAFGFVFTITVWTLFTRGASCEQGIVLQCTLVYITDPYLNLKLYSE